jgi:hypothetical protein
MSVLAAVTAPSMSDRLHQIPTEFWVRLGLGIAVIVGVVIVLRKIAGMNKVILSVIVGISLSVVGFSWIYERNEPRWATPAVSWLSGFFPSKGKITGH